MRASAFLLVILFILVIPFRPFRPALWVTPILAQQPKVAVTGTVADTSGGVLPDAAVEAIAAGQTVATATTGPDGQYRIELAAGTPHQLRVRRAGFGDQTLELHTAAGDMTRDIVMGIAAVSDSVVVTASRMRESRAAATESLSVFTAEDIAALGSHSLADILRQAPALNVESTGREGSATSLFARGGESDYNLVLIDGVRVNASGGQFDFGRISGGEIERVEVVRGAQSALYGSDAIGSVVQIFTKRAGPGDPPRAAGSIEGGTFNTWRGDLSILGGARRMVDYHAGVTYRGSDGAFGDVLPEKDRFDEPAFNGGAGFTLGGRAIVRTGFRYSNGRSRAVGPIVYGSRDTGTTYETKDRSWHLDYTQRLTSQLSHTANVAYFRSESLSADTIADTRYDVYAVLTGRPGAIFPDNTQLVRLVTQAEYNALNAGAQRLGAGEFLATTAFGVSDFPFSSRNQFRRPAFRYQADVTWNETQVLSGGYEYERETNPLNAAFLVENHAYFVQQQFKVEDRWFVTVGARINDNSRFGTEAMPKLSVGGFPVQFRAGPISSVKVFTNIGRGIKNPNFFELFGGGSVDGNSNLHPERARTIDAGAELTFDSQRWLGRVTYFDNRYDAQVAFRSSGPSGDGRPDYLNIDGSKAQGLELEWALQRAWLGVIASGSYSLVDTKVVAFVSTSEQFQPGQPLLRRPRHAATARLTYVRGRAALNFDMRYTGKRHDSSFLFMSSPQFPGRPIDIGVNPTYALFGIGGDVRVHDDLTVYLRIDNLTDEKYESALGYPGLPRAVMVGGRFSIGR